MPPKMTSKGRPRGAKTKIIALPKANKQRGVISKPKPFSKFSPLEKYRVIPECLTNKINASKYNTHRNNLRRVDPRLFLCIFDRWFL